MDKKDQKILSELVKNSRIPLNQLAKKVGLSREVVNYRIKNLIRQKIITEFYTLIDEKSLGYFRCACLFQLKGASKKKEKEFFNHIIKHKFTSYFGPIIGKWNAVFDVLYKNSEHLTEIIKKIEVQFSSYIENFVLVSNAIEQEAFQTKILGTISPERKEIKSEKAKIDEIDKKILKLLTKNSRIEYKELSQKINMTANAIKYRIKNLEKVGIIQGYTISINVNKLEYEWYNLQIKLTSPNEEKIKEFLRKNKKVIYFYKSLGNEKWDFDIGLTIKNSGELREFILKFRELFGNSTKINDLYLITEELKSNALPQGVFE
jgi:DNA-binding Lrp family transcriptional regulator